ncbi:MAG: EamA/RhaT family transporter [Verrucomicrobia bacterium]|nr:MAG: EamA/RhaT family transporter [Verrucomicrobiota bacterium]
MSAVQSDRHRATGILFLLLAALLWSLGGVLIKSVNWNPLAIAGVRSAFCAVTLVVLGRDIRFTWSRWEIAGGVSYAATVVLLVVATKMTTAANAIFLQYTAPIYVALLAPWILRERARPGDWITIIAALAGMSLFFLDKVDLTGTIGNLVGIACGISFALMTLSLRKQKNATPLASLIIGNCLAAAVGLAFIRSPLPQPGEWLILAVLGIVQLGLPYFLLAHAIRHVTAMEACLIPMIEPILNPIWVLFLIGERPGPYAMLGGAVVVGAVATRTIIAVRHGRNQPRTV